MKLHRVTYATMVLVLTSLMATNAVSAEQALTRLTNSTRFRIPFVVDFHSDGTAEWSAVLFGARDGGPMRQLQRVPLSSGGFEFSAPTDGAWQFAIRMTDSAGNMDESPGPLTPELQVVVDTTAPTLNLDLSDSGNGSVEVRWSSNDDFVPETLTIEYAEGPEGRWKVLDVHPSASGHTTIQSRSGNSMAVRAQLSDHAGNTGISSREIVLATAPPTSRSVAPSTNSADWQKGPVFAPPAATTPVGPSPFSQHGPIRTAPAPAPVHEQPVHMPTDNSGLAPVTAPPQQSASATPGFSNQSMSQTQYSVPSIPDNQVPRMNPSGLPWQMTGQYSVSPNATSEQLASQLVSKPLFNVAYTLEDVGPSGVSAVELFVTEDNGQQWFRYGNDMDVQSPMQVDVQGEGTFGFAIRVRNGVGFIDPPPQPGDCPEILVTVDQTAPSVEFGQPQVVVNGTASVNLTWKVFDIQSTAVRLEWATSLSGPWVPVFDWQANRSHYEWPVTPNMPHSMHFRLLAKDAAGNIGNAQTSQPVLIDLQRPKARMLGVEKVAQRIGY
ncbi:MAG: hypothetical protein MK102_10290 [Fuerstiella sp.]|nr:hypothetical protein [Fuerstiella sp.]